MARHGLLTQQPAERSAATAGQSPTAAAPPTGQTGDEQPNVSPEEQQVYDIFVDNVFSALYDEKALPQTIEALKGDGNPVDGLANTAVTAFIRVQDSAEEAGAPLSPDVLFHGGVEVVENLADFAEQAGIHTFKQEEIEAALFQAMDIYRSAKGGDGPPNPEIVQDFEQIVALDKAGKIDEIAPGLTERFGGAQPGAAGAR